MTRGEIRWYTFRLPDKRRPVLILTRGEVIEHLNKIIVVPATRTIRGLSTEVLWTEEDGMPVGVRFEFRRYLIGSTQLPSVHRVYRLSDARWSEMVSTLLSARGFSKNGS